MGRKRLLSSCFTSLFAWIKAVANPRFGDDVTRRVFAFDLFSQLSYKDTQIFRLLHTLASPTDVGHGEIGDHQIGSPVFHHIQSSIAIIGDAEIIAVRGKRGTQHPGDLGLIIHYEDMPWFAHT